ncbi:hypothetical protein CPXG_00004 [Cyanophage P-RSM6]|uniref:hypothetical protein n=1 Tax=Cyanophage P-RSM6 TaxID=929832 RepID=UPI0002C1886E|nr:hypothetical protein CPXG_00004 [Cyanophage P-RSM6]AGH56807.1 hypothetical protein CPXG_00004 [Cyanophage P-RSM6]|tara:strand:+ start:22 stop:456 length:435 start_codon:yes stop_codon:yes gene_type:complete
MKLLLSEVLQKAHNAKTKAEKINILRNNKSDALVSVFIINFDDSVVPVVPLGEDVPYRKNEAPAGTEHSKLEHEARILFHFFKGGSKLSPIKRETMFIQLLEGLHQDEAEVVIKAVNKNLHKRYKITQACVKEAFPEIVWGGRS